MKTMKIYIVKEGQYHNERDIRWIESTHPLPDGWMRVTRAVALSLIRDERYTRRTNPNFSGYCPTVIKPYRMSQEMWAKDANHRYNLDKSGYIVLSYY